MENKPLVSIAMATYNGEEFLREQLDSILRQTYPNLEIVITDDRSTDSTPAILDEYAARHANIRVYHNEENLGFRLNFEKALSLTRGDFIALADQDDVWMPEKIATLMDNLGDNMLVYCDSAYIDREGKPLGRNYSSHRKLISGSNLFLFDEDSGFGISGHANLFRREVLDRAVPIDPHFFHDHWIALHAMIAGTVDYVPDRLVGYRQHSRNVAGGLGIHLIPRVLPLSREERLRRSIARRQAILRVLPEGEEKFRSYLTRMVRYEQHPVFINRLKRKILRLGNLHSIYAARKRNVLRKAYRVLREF